MPLVFHAVIQNLHSERMFFDCTLRGICITRLDFAWYYKCSNCHAPVSYIRKYFSLRFNLGGKLYFYGNSRVKRQIVADFAINVLPEQSNHLYGLMYVRLTAY